MAQQMTSCWNWPWGRTVAGYGVLRHDGRTLYAHRLQCERRLGRRLVQGEVVRHECDNPACIRPDHLIVGTQADNCADTAKRHRGTVGERNRHAKLTAEQVIQIRASSGRVGEIARQFAVSHSIVSTIRSGKNWRHV